MATRAQPAGERVFVPHRECTETSGACFQEGRCLSNCRRRAKTDLEKRFKALEHRLVQLEIQVVALQRGK